MNLKPPLPWCSPMFTVMLLACTLQFTIAQELVVEWQRSRYGEMITNPKHMTVVAATGERYVIAQDGDELWSLIKYDASGVVKWRVSYRGVAPTDIAHNAGAVYVLGTALPALKLLKFDDLGTRGRLAWEWEYFASFGTTEARAIMADPVGDGVVIASESRHDDPPGRVLFRTMHTFRISADRTVDSFADYDLGLFAAGAELSPRAICADEGGNIYITGMSDGIRRADRPYDASDGYVSPSRLFVVKFNPKGTREWEYKSVPGPSEYGYDIEIDDSGVYVLGQSAPAHYNIPEPLLTGTTTLTKLGNSDGHLIRTVSSPSRIREWPTYQNSSREALVGAPESGGVHIAYDGIANSSVKLERYNASLDLQWSRELSMGVETHFNALVKMSSGHLAVSMNNNIVDGTEAVIGTYSIDNRLLDRIPLHRTAITQILPDANNKIHVAGLSTTIFDSRMAYEAKVGFSPYYSILPMELSVTEHLNLRLDRLEGLYWDVIELSWPCPSLPCESEFMASMSDQNGGWKEIITKPATITLPQSQDFNPFTLAIKSQSKYQTIYQLDGNLPENGINSIDIKSDWENKTLAVSIKTDGAYLPVTLTLIDSDGKMLGERKMIAPGEKVFSERFKVPVVYIRFSAPVKISLVSFQTRQMASLKFCWTSP
ncbi:MAG TPA: hypothetical protein VK658_11630 [Chryseolinea sp.]|nr:hypothetical protein [Chryseolinea sp.]